MSGKITNKQKKSYCCPRFKRWVEKGRICYAYDDTEKLDETAWFIPEEFGHIYYCPFCAAHVKGEGWGEYDETKKPDIDLVKMEA